MSDAGRDALDTAGGVMFERLRRSPTLRWPILNTWDDLCANHRDTPLYLSLIQQATQEIERALWRPIDDAPLDQTVLVYAAPREGMPGIVTVCRWHHDAGWCVCTLREVTHWRPLPAGPEDTP